jgi:hypothetical protein
MTTRQLAQVLGVSKSRGGQLAKRGCPMNDEESARAWYAAHIKPCRKPAERAERSAATSVPADHQEERTRAQLSLGQGNGSTEHLTDSLARMRAMERRLVAEIEEALSKRDYPSFALLRREHVQLVKALFVAEGQHLTILKTRGKLITIEAHLSLSSELLASLSVLINSLPGIAASVEERRLLEKAAEHLNTGVRELIERNGN